MVRYLATATIAVCLFAAVSESAEWNADYGKALEATRADDRPLLIVLDYPAEKAAAEDEAPVQPVSLTNEESAKQDTELLDPYNLCKIDVSTEYGKAVAKVFGVNSFPYTAIIDKTGSVIIFAKNGTLKDNEWSDTLLTYKSGDRTETMVMTSRANTSNVIFRKSSEVVPSNYCPSCQRNRGY